jgi:superfamily II DNA/RNA helicase
MGFQTPTEVQSRVIPHILNQKGIIVISKTGSGKTAVFGIPLLQMTDTDALEPQGLILTPTRELAVQIDNDLKQMSAYLPHKTVAVYGQHSMHAEIQALKKGASIVIGTPGRVYDHIRHGNLKVKKIRFLVLDEADRMLDMGFIDQVFKIIKTIPKSRTTLLLSATIPTEIQHICRGYMKHPQTVEIDPRHELSTPSDRPTAV